MYPVAPWHNNGQPCGTAARHSKYEPWHPTVAQLTEVMRLGTATEHGSNAAAGAGVLTYCFSDEGNCFGRRERYKALPNY